MNYYSDYHNLMMCERNIRYYQALMEASNDPYQRIFYENLLNSEKNMYYHLYSQYQLNYNKNNEINKSNLRQLTLKELSQYDGSNGKPAYVAINGIVYDVSLEATWGGGTHFGLYAGQDLTNQFNGCHGGIEEVLRNLPQIGLLVDS